MIFRILFVLTLIFFANEGFALAPWWHRSGAFNIADVGNALIWIGIFLTPLLARKRKELVNLISALILFYVLFASIHIVLAKANYGQSLFNGLIGIRHQFYYLSFFLFLLLLDDTKFIVQLLDTLAIISIILVILGIVNYFGPTILYHKWAHGQKMRGGITRAFIPGMSVVTFSALWVFNKWIGVNQKIITKASTIFLLAAHFFRQSRMRLIGLIFMMSSVLVIKRKWKPLLVLLVCSLATYVMLEAKIGKDIMANLFTSAYEDVVEQTGTMRPRLKEIRIDLKEFRRHPLIGSGLAAIRSTTGLGGSRLRLKLKDLSYRSDLGYTHWLKFYGMVGVVWLLLFFFFQAYYGIKALKKCVGIDKAIAMFTLTYLGYIIVSFFTLNHLMFPRGIVMVCLNSAIIIRLHFNSRGRIIAPDTRSQP